MSSLTLSAGPPAAAMPVEYAEVLRRIDQLTRAHGMVYDLSIGALCLEFFFGGSAEEYYSRDRSKETVFADFVATCREALATHGQSESRLRNCVRAYLVYRGLPSQAKEALLFSHLVELARCRDPGIRARLAAATIECEWTVAQLRDAVTMARGDARPEPAAPSAAPAPTPRLSAARLVSRGEKFVPAVASWTSAIAAADPAKLTRGQRERLRQAITSLEAKLTELRARLAP